VTNVISQIVKTPRRKRKLSSLLRTMITRTKMLNGVKRLTGLTRLTRPRTSTMKVLPILIS